MAVGQERDSTLTSSDSSANASGTAQTSYGRSDHYAGDRGKYYQELRSKWPLSKMAPIHAEKFSSLIDQSDTVVDFGCGSGEILAATTCQRKVGVEINALARNQAQQKGIEVFEETASLPSDTADVVISHHALEHVPYPIQALKELNRILKPSGVLGICVPVEYPYRTRKYDPNDVANHLHTWTPQLLGNTLREAGFIVVPESVWMISRRVPRQIVTLYPHMPKMLAIALAHGFAIVKGHRELVAHVRPLPDPNHG